MFTCCILLSDCLSNGSFRNTKRGSQTQYGPFTTGGAINMVSTSIPDSLKVKIKSRFGNFNTGQVYAAAGQSNGRLGYLLEYHSNKSDGFKN